MDFERIKQYKTEPLRYHLVISREMPQDENCVWNVGHSLANFLVEQQDREYLPEVFAERCGKLSRQFIGAYNGIDNMLQMTHWGLLFEPNLHFDINAFVRKLAQNCTLVLYTDGKIQNDRLYLTDAESDYYINLSGINYLVL